MPDGAAVGEPLPGLYLEAWRNASGLEDLQGKVVLLDFWATWCRPCQKAFPALNRLHAAMRPRGGAVLGICASTGGDEMDTILREHGLCYPCARDISKQTEKALGVRHFPATWLIGRDGVVLAEDLQPEEFERAMDEALRAGG